MAKKSRALPAANKAGQLRIIGGIYRSRKLLFPAIEGLRPTGNRIRETLFNWLAPSLKGATCLDLFAGSGALGMEALSRGAGHVTFVDSSPLACRYIRENLDLLGTTIAECHCEDGIRWLGQTRERFDIVFLDPPFSHNLLETVTRVLDECDLVRPGGFIYIEDAVGNPAPSLPVTWRLFRDKKAGNVRYRLYQRPQIV